MLKILPIMLLSIAQKSCLAIMLNIMPATTAIMPQFIHNFIILIDYISISSLQAAMFYICYAAMFLY